MGNFGETFRSEEQISITKRDCSLTQQVTNMPFNNEQKILLDEWKSISRKMQGLHFQFEEQFQEIGTFQKLIDDFINDPNEQNFETFWNRMHSANMGGNAKNMIKRFRKANLTMADVRNIIKKIIDSKEFDDNWVKDLGFKGSLPSTIGEFYGRTHIEEAPIFNDAVISGMKLFGYTFKRNRYQVFKDTFEEFKKEYLDYFSGDSPITGTKWEVPINLEIDQLLNSIDKIHNLLDIERVSDEDEKCFYKKIWSLKNYRDKPWIWWVNQGKTQKIEVEAECIWAPLKDKGGKLPYHWENVQLVRKEDIVISYSNGVVNFISMALEDAEISTKPERMANTNWETRGVLAKLEYHKLRKDISLTEFAKDIYDLSLTKGPINKTHGINQGYLYEINRKVLGILQNVAPNAGWPKFSKIESEVENRKFWRIRAGQGGTHWPDWFDGNYIAIGWNKINPKVGNIKEQAEIKYPTDGTNYVANSFKYLFEMKKGDIIVVSTNEGGAIGEVSSDEYVFDDDSDGYKHKRYVIWLKENFNKKAYGKDFYNILKHQYALVPIANPEHIEIIENQILKDNPNPNPRSDEPSLFEYENFFSYLSIQGYLFDTFLIENFLLSLKVKPFIILTGNSGTGKTKIAQLFAKYLENRATPISRNVIETKVKVGKSFESHNSGWTFDRESYFEYFPEIKERQGEFDIEVDGIMGKGNFQFATRLFYDRNNKTIRKRLRELAQIDPKQKVTLKIFLEVEESNQTFGDRCALIPVGANWTENRHIVGFFNVILNKYHSTNSLNLILRAIGDKKAPYFLILDEMNLSHVERYFSDFLSAIESEESIPLHTYNPDKDDDCMYPPKSIYLPPNLSVIGTVNVDETTYMFSPKVLDRANTIEFLPSSAVDYMGGTSNNEEMKGDIVYIENPLSDIDLDPKKNLRKMDINEMRKRFSGIKTGDGKELWGILTDEINKFQNDLKKAGFEFGFRVINEVIRFMYVAWKYENAPRKWQNWQRYFDAQIKQKMLPKIHGSQRTLGNLFVNLFSLCCGGDIGKEEKKPREFVDDPLADIPYPTSARKIAEMDKILNEQRYVSFTR